MTSFLKTTKEKAQSSHIKEAIRDFTATKSGCFGILDKLKKRCKTGNPRQEQFYWG